MNDDYSGPIRIRYEYKEDTPVQLKYAHGVWGGINSQGEIEMNFYVESDVLPEWSECILEQDGSLGPEKVPHDERQKNVVRHIHTKLILNYPTARAVHYWLENHLDILDDSENIDINSPAGSSGSFEQ